MFSLFATNVRLARPVFSVFSNPVTRSFITSSRVADAIPETASPKPTTEKNKKSGRKELKTDAEKSEKLKLRKIDMTPPPKPPPPYFRFVKEYREKQPKPSTLEEMRMLLKECGAQWQALPDTTKKLYTGNYDQEFQEYRRKKDAWFESIDPKMAERINAARKKAGKKKIRFKSHGPTRPTPSFVRFIRHLREQSTDKVTSPTGFVRRAGEIWRSMPEDEKQQYNDDYRRDREEWRARQTVKS